MFKTSLIGKKIKEIRKSKKISQEKLAEMISMNHRSILRIENAHTIPTIETLSKIADVLDVKLIDFFETQEFEQKDKIIEDINNCLQKMSDKDLKSFYKSIYYFIH